jgi:hypothetical protein
MPYPLGHRSSPRAFGIIAIVALMVLGIVTFIALRQITPVYADHPDNDTGGTLQAPASGEGSDGVGWEGTVPPGSAGTGGVALCANGINSYYYTLHLEGVAEDYYDTRDSTTIIRIFWDPEGGDVTTQNLALYLFRDGSAVASSDSPDRNQEAIVVKNLPGGEYDVTVCSNAVLLPQDFKGLATFNVTLKAGSVGLPDPEVTDSGIRFSATTIVDPQRDVAEPSLRVDKKWNIYACGPFGASRAAEYAQKSEDLGDTFRILGTPPEGRIATGGGGDCEISVGTELNDQGEYTLSYTGLEALVNFSTGVSRNAGRTFIGQNIATTQFGVDRQWMETSGEQEVYLGFNSLARGYVVARSTDGGFSYPTNVIGAPSSNVFRPGPIRIDLDPTHNPLYNPAIPGVNDEIIYFTYTGADQNSVWVARSYDEGMTWTQHKVDEGFNPNNLFSALAIDTEGNLYSAWTEKGSFNTYYSYSLRPTTGAGGAADVWSEKRLVNRNPVNSTAMPWIEAGSPGNISISYYGSPADGNIEEGDNLLTAEREGFRGYWHVYVSTSFNALDDVDANGNVPFALTQATTHPVHWDSICLSGTACALIFGDRTLLDFFQNRLDPDGHIHVVFNQSNKIPRAEAGRIAIVTYVKQIAGPSLYATGLAGDANRGDVGPVYPDPRPIVRNTSGDPLNDALFTFSEFAETPERINLEALDITNLSIQPSCMTGLEQGSVDIELNLANISDAALTQALADQTAAGSPASSLIWVVRWFSGTDPYSAVAKWSPAEGFTFGFNDLSFVQVPVDAPNALQFPRVQAGGVVVENKLETYPGDQPLISGARVNDTTLRMTVQPSMFQSLILPKQPDGDPIIRPAVVGDRIYDVTAFTFGNQSAAAELQTYLNQGDSTAPFDHILQPTDPQLCSPTAVTVGTPTAAPVSNNWLPMVAALGALVVVGGLALARRRSR